MNGMNAPEARHERLRHVVSPSNPVLKIFRRALLDGTTRQGWLGMEGPLLLEEALNARSAATVPGWRKRSELNARSCIR